MNMHDETAGHRMFAGAGGASVVEREAMWRPDVGTKPCRILLDYAVEPDSVTEHRPPQGAWVLAAAVLAAGWASINR